MMYLRAWIVDNKIAHCHCSDLPITHSVLEVSNASFIVTASLSMNYVEAAEIIGGLSWNNDTLAGFDFASQNVIKL